MKNFKYILMMLAGVFAMSSCSDDNIEATYDPANAVPATLNAINSDYVLQKTDADNVFAEFTYTKADFGVPVAVKYTLQAALAGTDFATPVSLGTSESVTPFSVTVSKINNLAISNGIAELQAGSLEFRVLAEANGQSGSLSGIAVLNSNVIKTNVTPYAAKRTYKSLSVPGAYQGWDPTNYSQALYSKKGDGVYEGYIYFSDASEFKFADGSWDVNWGSSDGATLKKDGDNLKVTEAGTYKINVDINTLTCSVDKANWSIIGDAVGGWEAANDVAMTYDANNKLYRATVKMAAGTFKFRANQAWAYDLGASKEANAEKGDLSYGGDNITIDKAGEYTIALDFNGGIYTYKVYSGKYICDYPVLNMPGAINGWNPETADYALVSLKDDGVYSGYIYFSEGGEFKFAKGSWDANWGSTDGEHLVAGGDNIKSGVGLYKFTVMPDQLSMSMELTSWSLIGDAVGGWENANDKVMTWDAATGKLTATVDMVAGAFKFRANQAWAYDFGVDKDGNLAAGAGNIAVAEDGNYTVTLDLVTSINKGHYVPSYTIKKN